jgi:hypothetical protein
MSGRSGSPKSLIHDFHAFCRHPSPKRRSSQDWTVDTKTSERPVYVVRSVLQQRKSSRVCLSLSYSLYETNDPSASTHVVVPKSITDSCMFADFYSCTSGSSKATLHCSYGEISLFSAELPRSLFPQRRNWTNPCPALSHRVYETLLSILTTTSLKPHIQTHFHQKWKFLITCVLLLFQNPVAEMRWCVCSSPFPAKKTNHHAVMFVRPQLSSQTRTSLDIHS